MILANCGKPIKWQQRNQRQYERIIQKELLRFLFRDRIRVQPILPTSNPAVPLGVTIPVLFCCTGQQVGLRKGVEPRLCQLSNSLEPKLLQKPKCGYPTHGYN